MADLGKAYVQIVPTTKGIGNSLKSELEGAGNEGGAGFGLKFASMAKKLIVGAALGKVVKDSLDAGGALQQSFGGLVTIYGDAAEQAKKYAYEASKAGISANTYAEQAVSFGAALKQAYGGDTTLAMEAANKAILDMADNSSKFGTEIQSVQNAYQGFAKGNYTMLDNLKLGYGGTKTEMERLLKDAEKLPAAMGKKFDLSNLGDVYDAIHLIQEDLKISGVAAKEAETTFTGSMGAMKAAAQNFLANLALGEDVTKPLQEMIGNAKVFLEKNLLPMIGNILKAIPTVLKGSQDIGRSLVKEITDGIKNNAENIVKSGVDLLKSLVTGMVENAVLLVQAAVEIGKALWQALSSLDWVTIGTDIINSLKTGLTNAASTLLGEGATMETLISSIMSKMGDFIEIGGDIILNIVNGISAALPDIISKAGEITINFANAVSEHAPELLTRGVEVIKKLIEGIANGLPEIGTKAGEVIANFAEMLLNNAPQILETGITLIGELAAGIIKAIPKVLECIFNLQKAIIEKFKTMDWRTIGQDILAGIAQGLVNFGQRVVQAAKDCAKKVIDAFKDFFGIHSPSTKMMEIAKDLIQGLINGIKAMVANAASSMLAVGQALINKLNPAEWVEKGRELGAKLAEGIGNAKENVSNKIGELAEAARGKISSVNLSDVGASIGNSIANGIKSSKQNISNQMDDIINTLTNKGSSIQNKMAAINYAQSHALMGGAVGTAELYGAAGDEQLETESQIVELLERYLPIIATSDNYDAINRKMGWGLT